MIPVFFDLETFWSQTHTLTKMGAVEYTTHPDTEIQSVAIKIGKGETRVVFGEAKIRKLFSMIDWSDKFLIAHNNSEFDGMLAAWRLGARPARWGCTMAMARLFFAKTCGLSLAKVAVALGCPIEKGNLEEVGTKGKKLADFTEDEIAKMVKYNVFDTEICAFIFHALAHRVGARELRIIDATIRMLVEPQFELDSQMLWLTLKAEQAAKSASLLELAHRMGIGEVTASALLDGVEVEKYVKTQLSSSKKFSDFLISQGVEVPMKPSPTNPLNYIPALSKTDEGFIALQEHENDLVAMAAVARQGAKSTLLETRIQKFLSAGEACGGKLPIPLKYAGADTTMRWSGWSFNPQNLPRISPDNPKRTDALRKSLRAPKGYKVVVADLSGIELRVNMFLWKVPYAMKLFQADPAKADLYKSLASQMYEIPMADVSKPQRQMGKCLHLGCGFGVGGAKFKDVAKALGGLVLTTDESKDMVYAYRDQHTEIVRGWKTCHEALSYIDPSITQGPDIDPWGLCHPCPDGIYFPALGSTIRYPGLHQEIDEKSGKAEWWYGEGRKRARIYAGKITENIVQHLARQVVADNMLDFRKTEMGKKYPLALTVHDELVYVAREEEAEETLAVLQGIMRTPPKWWPELVVWSEGDVADTYGDAK